MANEGCKPVGDMRDQPDVVPQWSQTKTRLRSAFGDDPYLCCHIKDPYQSGTMLPPWLFGHRLRYHRPAWDNEINTR